MQEEKEAEANEKDDRPASNKHVPWGDRRPGRPWSKVDISDYQGPEHGQEQSQEPSRPLETIKRVRPRKEGHPKWGRPERLDLKARMRTIVSILIEAGVAPSYDKRSDMFGKVVAALQSVERWRIQEGSVDWHGDVPRQGMYEPVPPGTLDEVRPKAERKPWPNSDDALSSLLRRILAERKLR